MPPARATAPQARARAHARARAPTRPCAPARARGPCEPEQPARAPALVAAAAAACVCAGVSAAAPAAYALGPVTIPLRDAKEEVVPCARGTLGMSFGKPRCLVVRATADNPTDKPISNADVFGRVRDALGQNALDVDEASDGGRISNVATPIPPGASEVTFPLVVSERQMQQVGGDLVYDQMKAVGYAGNFLAGQASGWLGNELDLDCANGLDCEDEFAKMEAELDAELAS